MTALDESKMLAAREAASGRYISSEGNMLNRGVWAAQRKARDKMVAAKRALADAAGVEVDALRFTNEVGCRYASGHVYYPTYAPEGLGRQHCILCGRDDWDMP